MSLRTLISIALGLLFLYGLFTVGFPFLLALVIAIFLEPVNQLLMKHLRMKRIAAVNVTCALFTLLLLGIAYLIGLKVFYEVVGFWDRIPEYLNDINTYVTNAIDQTKLFYQTLPEDTAAQLQAGVENGIKGLTNSLNGLIGTISTSFLNLAKAIPNLFIVFIIFIVALFMFSAGLTTMKQSFLSLFEETTRTKMDRVLEDLRKSVFGFIRAQIILSALTYVVSLTGLLILRVDYPMAIALLIIVVDILPVLGTGSVLVPWACYMLLTGNAFVAVGLVLLFVLITVFRRIVEPKILGDAVGIGPLSTLISLFVGFELVGVIGLFLGPIVVIIYQAMRRVGLLNLKIKLD